MSSRLRLALFDVDGTLIDSQRFILAAMRAAFADLGRPAPPDGAIRAIIGLSLVEAAAALDPGLSDVETVEIAACYKRAFIRIRAETGGEAAMPLYPGARAALARLSRTERLLGVATGKARRGLDHLLDAHDLRGFFLTLQTSDDAPSKPHPGMVLNALRATGAQACDAVVIGDTIYDVAMARNAGARAIGVAWGYHAPDALLAAGAEIVIDHFDALDAALEALE
ncbi:MAG: HAD-IA family hydrolase [Rubrimonas sp.]|uniref:HAD-IA family hydrolase n=1 Tax=Rubrimonas sp. TaxID=2036015 RepID=UPI002FDEAD78